MATRKIVPRADNEGGIGTALKQWASGWIKALTVTTINALTLAAQAVGFTITGGTESKTLTVLDDVSVGGAAINPTLPAFLASATQQNNKTGDGTAYTITFGTEIFDQNNNFDSVSTFTAPVTGRYCFSVQIFLEGLSTSHTSGALDLITTNRTYWLLYYNFAALQAGGYLTLTAGCFADMDAGETAYLVVTVSGGTKVVSLSATQSRISGFLVC